MNIDDIRAKLKDRNLSMVAGLSGVSYQTLRRIGRDEKYIPKHDVFLKLVAYFEERK